MSPRPAPDLDRRRDDLARVARTIAEAEGWDAVTVRRVAGEIGATQPVVYSAFTSRQGLIDAVAVSGFRDLAAAMESVPATPGARARAYLAFSIANRSTYEVMFTQRTGLPFATAHAPPPLRAAFAALRDTLPVEDDTVAEVLWAALHGLADLAAAGRLRPDAAEPRIDVLQRLIAIDAPAGTGP